jgi:hypothetical protein
MSHNSSTWKAEAEGLQIRGQPKLHSKTLSQKTKGSGCVSVVEHLPSMLKALGLILGTTKKGKEWTMMLQDQ